MQIYVYVPECLCACVPASLPLCLCFYQCTLEILPRLSVYNVATEQPQMHCNLIGVVLFVLCAGLMLTLCSPSSLVRFCKGILFDITFIVTVVLLLFYHLTRVNKTLSFDLLYSFLHQLASNTCNTYKKTTYIIYRHIKNVCDIVKQNDLTLSLPTQPQITELITYNLISVNAASNIYALQPNRQEINVGIVCFQNPGNVAYQHLKMC